MNIKTLLSTSMILLAISCSHELPDPWAEAIGAAVRRETGMPIHVESATKTDSTTYITELQRRRGIYELRIIQNTQREQKYRKLNMPKNARIMRKATLKDHKIIAGLDSIRTHMGKDTLRIAYYDFEFEYRMADQDGNRTKPKKAYATMTPEGRVLTWAQKQRDIHKTTGLVIPGYRKLLDELKETE